MSEEKKVQKFKLARNPDEVRPDEESLTPPAIPAKPKPPLTLKETETPKKYVSTDADDIRVTNMLDDAFEPDRERARRSSIIRGAVTTTVVLGIFLLSVGLTYSFAHILMQWPMLEPISWYLPFILSIACSVAALFKSYRILTCRRRSFTLAVTGVCLAVGLTYWNIQVLHVATHSGGKVAETQFWMPSTLTQRLMLYEINSCQGISSSSYATVTANDYKKIFRKMPRDQWEIHFRRYLFADEFSRVTPINIDDMMNLVTQRMEQNSTEGWDKLYAALEEPPFVFRMKQWILTPYTFLLKRL